MRAARSQEGGQTVQGLAGARKVLDHVAQHRGVEAPGGQVGVQQALMAHVEILARRPRRTRWVPRPRPPSRASLLRRAGSRPSSRGPAAVRPQHQVLDAFQCPARGLALPGLLLDVVLARCLVVGLLQDSVGRHARQPAVAADPAAQRSLSATPNASVVGTEPGGTHLPPHLQVGGQATGPAGTSRHSWRHKPYAHAGLTSRRWGTPARPAQRRRAHVRRGGPRAGVLRSPGGRARRSALGADRRGRRLARRHPGAAGPVGLRRRPCARGAPVAQLRPSDGRQPGP